MASDTFNIMLLRENDSVRINGRQAVRSRGHEPSRTDRIPVGSRVRQPRERDLASLRAEQREIPVRLRAAREFGDSANNDEHLAIPEQEAVLAVRIARHENILMRADVVEGDAVDDSARIGSSVSVLDLESGDKLE